MKLSQKGIIMILRRQGLSFKAYENCMIFGGAIVPFSQLDTVDKMSSFLGYESEYKKCS